MLADDLRLPSITKIINIVFTNFIKKKHHDDNKSTEMGPHVPYGIEKTDLQNFVEAN